MEKRKVAPPKVRHSVGHKEEKAKFRRVLKHFTQVMTTEFDRQADTGKTGWDSDEPDDLLRLRKKLVEYIKKGMLERENREIEVALYAAFIWFNRQTFERKVKILQEWG